MKDRAHGWAAASGVHLSLAVYPKSGLTCMFHLPHMMWAGSEDTWELKWNLLSRICKFIWIYFPFLHYHRQLELQTSGDSSRLECPGWLTHMAGSGCWWLAGTLGRCMCVGQLTSWWPGFKKHHKDMHSKKGIRSHQSSNKLTLVNSHCVLLVKWSQDSPDSKGGEGK